MVSNTSDVLSSVITLQHSQQYLQEQMSSMEQQVQQITEVQHRFTKGLGLLT